MYCLQICCTQTKLGQEVLEGESTNAELVAIMGFYQTQGSNEVPTQHELLAHNSLSQEEEGTSRPTLTSAGRIVVYGDSNCADNSHMQKGNCFMSCQSDHTSHTLTNCIKYKFNL